MEAVLAVVTATVVGLMVGVEFSVAFVINPILTGLDVGPSIEGSAHGGRMLGRAMPFWYFGSLILIAVVAALAWGTPSSTAALVAAGLLVVSIVMSITVLVPINNHSKTWTAAEHPADWREQKRRWDGFHYARVAVIVAAFVLLLVAIVVR
ncbi:DUF1772 domain-containing protein [Humibacter antri]